MKMKEKLSAMLAAIALAISALIIFLYFADICEPTAFYINATNTGNLLCPACVLTFAAAVVMLFYKPDDVLGIILPHSVIVLSLTVEVLTVTNFFNHSMELITSDISKSLLLVYATLSALLSLSLLWRAFSERRKKREHESCDI